MARPIACVAICFIIFTLLIQSWSFKPRGPRGHAGIVTQALKAARGTDVNGVKYRFAKSQIEKCVDGNVHSDESVHFFDSAYHCDSDDVEYCSDRILKARETLLADLRDASSIVGRSFKPTCARIQFGFGEILHTIQDFYAHSNYIDSSIQSGNANPPPYRGFGTEVIHACRHCEQCPSQPWLLEGVQRTELTTGFYDPFVAADYLLTTSALNPLLPGIQDTLAVCNLVRTYPKGKCLHGYADVPRENGCDGISKDIGTRETPTSNHPYSTAFITAQDHTTRFVQELVDELSDPKELSCLMSAAPQIGFVIDTTGSMDDAIAAVVASVLSIAQIATDKAEDDIRPNFLLETFNDPNVGVPTVFDSFETFRSAVRSLQAFGGEDCPEYSMSGLLAALQVADPKSTIYTFTDASAKDGEMYYQVALLALEKEIEIVPMLSGRCSPFDPVYYSLAQASQGHVFLIWKGYVELLASQITALVAPQLRSNRTSVFYVQTELAASTDSRWNTSVLLDSSAQFATFTVSMAVKDKVTVTDALGRDVSSLTGQNISALTVNADYAYQVTVPVVIPGYYTVSVSGQGHASLSVRVSSLLRLESLSTAEYGGRHMDLVPSQSSPVAYQQTILVFDVTVVATAVGFTSTTGSPLRVLLMSPGNQLLLSLPAELLEDDPYGAVSHWKVTFPCPSVPFRVQVVGSLVSTGEPFQRTWKHMLFPQLVTIQLPKFNSLMGGFAIGSTTHIPFNVTNHGINGSFLVSITSSPYSFPMSLSMLQADDAGRRTWVDLTPTPSSDSSTFAAPVFRTTSGGNVPGGASMISGTAVELSASSTSSFLMKVFIPELFVNYADSPVNTMVSVVGLDAAELSTSYSFDSVLLGCAFNSTYNGTRSLCPHTQCDLDAQRFSSYAPAFVGVPSAEVGVQTYWQTKTGMKRLVSCGCTGNWTGTNCELPNCHNNCTSPSHGTCIAYPSSAICVCKDGWAGEDCSMSVGPISFRVSVPTDLDDPFGGLPAHQAITQTFYSTITGLPSLLMHKAGVSFDTRLLDRNTNVTLMSFSGISTTYALPSTFLGRLVYFQFRCIPTSNIPAVDQIPMPLILYSNTLNFSSSASETMNIALSISTGEIPSNLAPPTLSSCSSALIVATWDDNYLVRPRDPVRYRVCLMLVSTGRCVMDIASSMLGSALRFRLAELTGYSGVNAADNRYVVAVSVVQSSFFARSQAFLVSFTVPATDFSWPSPFVSSGSASSCQYLSSSWNTTNISPTATMRVITPTGTVQQTYSLSQTSSSGFDMNVPAGLFNIAITSACQWNTGIFGYSPETSTTVATSVMMLSVASILNAEGARINGWGLRLYRNSGPAAGQFSTTSELEITPGSTVNGCGSIVVTWFSLVNISSLVNQALSSATMTITIRRGTTTVVTSQVRTNFLSGFTVINLPSTVTAASNYTVFGAMSFPSCSASGTTGITVSTLGQSAAFSVVSEPVFAFVRAPSSPTLPFCSKLVPVIVQLAECGVTYTNAQATTIMSINNVNYTLWNSGQADGRTTHLFNILRVLESVAFVNLPLTLTMNLYSSINDRSTTFRSTFTLIPATPPTVIWGTMRSSAVNLPVLPFGSFPACSPLEVSFTVILNSPSDCGNDYRLVIWDGVMETDLASTAFGSADSDRYTVTYSLISGPVGVPLEFRLSFYDGTPSAGRPSPILVSTSPIFRFVDPVPRPVLLPNSGVIDRPFDVAMLTNTIFPLTEVSKAYQLEAIAVDPPSTEVVALSRVLPNSAGLLSFQASASQLTNNTRYVLSVRSEGCLVDRWNSTSSGQSWLVVHPSSTARSSTQVKFTKLPSLAVLSPCSLTAAGLTQAYFGRMFSTPQYMAWQSSRASTCNLGAYLNITAANGTSSAVLFGTAINLNELSAVNGETRLSLHEVPGLRLEATSTYRVMIVNLCDNRVLGVSGPLSIPPLSSSQEELIRDLRSERSIVPLTALASYSAQIFSPSFSTIWDAAAPVPAIEYRTFGTSPSYVATRFHGVPQCAKIGSSSFDTAAGTMKVELISAATDSVVLVFASTDWWEIWCDTVFCKYRSRGDMTLNDFVPGIVPGSYFVRISDDSVGVSTMSAPFLIVSNVTELTTSTLTFGRSFNGSSKGSSYVTNRPELLDRVSALFGLQLVQTESTVDFTWKWTNNILAVSLSLWRLTGHRVSADGQSVEISPSLTGNNTASMPRQLVRQLSGTTLNVGTLTFLADPALDAAAVYCVEVSAAAPVTAVAVSPPFVIIPFDMVVNPGLTNPEEGSEPDETSESSSGFSAGAISGLVIGIVVGICLLSVLVYLLLSRRGKDSSSYEAASQPRSPTDGPNHAVHPPQSPIAHGAVMELTSPSHSAGAASPPLPPRKQPIAHNVMEPTLPTVSVPPPIPSSKRPSHPSTHEQMSSIV